MEDRVFTSESVTEGHPDKVCDQISDAILDEIIGQDAEARVACETLTTTGLVLVAGEVTTDYYADVQKVVRKTLEQIGYTNPEYGLDYQDCSVLTSIHEQSPDIAQGVDSSEEKEQGAGDQGLMFGYACDDTDVLMPLPITLAHRLAKRLADVRKDGTLPWSRPDGKTQVSVQYSDGKPVGVDKVVVAIQHDPEVDNSEIHSAIKREVIEPICGDSLSDETAFFINSTGVFEKGGPEADTGLTGRKIIVDTYGGYGRHGGGAFSGKDPSKVDRSASYMARYIAKNLVAAGLASRCEVQLAYSIGEAEPVSIYVDSFGTGALDDQKLSTIVKDLFPVKPREIIDALDLKKPIYQKTAAYGHFGREEADFTWEKTDKTQELKKYLNGRG
ncbi:MAG: methionine adenosyltransferase [Candidatus Marinimicrobia bacterium]|nr:methionine adenosyltransferase [Candidatus Neomarinimicrobiota bacterium]